MKLPSRFRRFRVVVLAAAIAFYSGARPLARGEEQPIAAPPKVVAAAVAALAQRAEKVEVQEQPWGWIRWLMNAKIDPRTQMTLGVVQVNAGHKNPLHVHANCEELLYLLSGSCEHRIGEQTVVLRPGSVLRIPAGVRHAAKVLGDEPMTAIVIYNTGQRQFAVAEE